MTVISMGKWLIGYDKKAGLWCGYHKDRPEEEWNAYSKDDLLWNIGHHEIPGPQRDVIRQVVNR